MKLKVKFAKAAFLVTLLAGLVMTFAGEALAAKNPNWVGIKRYVAIVRNTDQSIPITAPNYWLLRIPIGHTNNSQDRDIINIYEKQVRVNTTVNRTIGRLRQRWGAEVSTTVNFNSNVQVEMWPGMSHDIGYRIPLGNLISPSNPNDSREWRWMNEEVEKLVNRHGSGADALFKDTRVGYDFHIRSRPTADYENRRRPRG